MRLKRAGLLAALALAAVNLFTGAPLLALRIGAAVQGGRGETEMLALLTVVAVLSALAAALVWALARLGAAYERAAGHPPARRRQTAWLRPFNAPQTDAAARAPMAALDVVVVVAVVVAVIAFEAWFLFFAGSPLA